MTEGPSAPLVSAVLPTLAEELHALLIEQSEVELAGQVPGLRIVGRCRCGDDFCAMFYVLPEPIGPYGPEHRNVLLDPKVGMLVLDVGSERIAAVEALYREDVKKVFDQLMPLSGPLH